MFITPDTAVLFTVQNSNNVALNALNECVSAFLTHSLESVTFDADGAIFCYKTEAIDSLQQHLNALLASEADEYLDIVNLFSMYIEESGSNITIIDPSINATLMNITAARDQIVSGHRETFIDCTLLQRDIAIDHPTPIGYIFTFFCALIKNNEHEKLSEAIAAMVTMFESEPELVTPRTKTRISCAERGKRKRNKKLSKLSKKINRK